MIAIKESINSGIINDTYLAEEGGRDIILQRVNTAVFPEPEAVMKNMVAVTEHLRKKLLAQGRDPERETLTFLQNPDGTYLSYKDGAVYRKSLYIRDSVTLARPRNAEDMREAGRILGDFEGLLSDFPAEELSEVLPGFHNTHLRFERFLKAVKDDPMGRADAAREEIEGLLTHADLAEHFVNTNLPLRVTHNDTKIANILFDKATGKALALIDLETVMPGLSVLDFGDAIRSGANRTASDDADLSKVGINREYYDAFLEGFLFGSAGRLTGREIEELPHGAAVIMFEQSVRFLTDYLEGDWYFKTAYPDHNLVRAKNQRRLLASFLETVGW